MSPTFRKRTIRFPVTLSVVLMVLNVALMVCWIVLLANSSFWSALTIGTILFVLILVGLVVYLILTIKEIRLNQRQSNFVDSVTHELKSPIASLKLYLETLQLRSVGEEERRRFYHFMMEDVARLDHLINHLLEIGRLDAIVDETVPEQIELEPLLHQCAESACSRYKKPIENVDFDIEPVQMRAGRLALEMIFRNLLDNAVKYGADDLDVMVTAKRIADDRVMVRVADNGPGIPAELRKKVFGLFYRGGNELERKKQGTGLGLYIVQTLVRRMKGRVNVYNRGRDEGSVFIVELPG
ncbi:Sensor protein kinase WalK [Planctomycetes bacterium Pan216]|uniref:histidine kinase n=1 Tax=Kolteria novifilia TaxID=2527975 RepID=A0A518B9P6_9BACT|nr:Sensor protein kinase WalK [Planctomycetes bacterium Pan216]